MNAARLALRLLGAALLALCIVILGAWTIGLTISDRYLWSQYLSWLPSILVLPAAFILWAIAVALKRLARAKRPWDKWPSRLVALWLLCAAGYLFIFELRAYRLPLASRTTTPHLRVLHWNITAVHEHEQITTPLLAQSPDIAFLVNPSAYAKWKQIPAQLGDSYHLIALGDITVASRIPIIQWGSMILGLEGLPPSVQARLNRKRIRIDPGRAHFFELDTRDRLGKTIIVWVIDMPSEPRLARWSMAKTAAAAIANWRGVVFTPNGAIPSDLVGFPEPDLVVGDFNIPRGGASLSQLLPNMHNAFDQAGAGYAATWPRAHYRTPIPLVHIDQTFVANPLRAARYEVIDPGAGMHQMQVADVVAK